MKKYVFLIIAVALVAAVALAELNGEQLVTADGGLSLTTGFYGVGPNGVDVATDGDATIVFYWFADASRSTVVKTSPTFNLRSAYPPRHFTFSGGPDSAYVDVDTATEVIVSW